MVGCRRVRLIGHARPDAAAGDDFTDRGREKDVVQLVALALELERPSRALVGPLEEAGVSGLDQVRPDVVESPDAAQGGFVPAVVQIACDDHELAGVERGQAVPPDDGRLRYALL